MKRWGWVIAAVGLWTGCTDGDGIEPDPTPEPEPIPTRADHVFLLEMSSTEANWMDFAYLAAVPASAHLNGGRPAVLAVHDFDVIPEATIDVLERMLATDAYVLNGTATLDAVDAVHDLSADNASVLSAQFTDHWTRSDTLVLADGQHYGSALMAASLAGRLNAPLVFTADLPEGERQRIEAELEVTETLWVDLSGEAPSAPDATALRSADAILEWMNSQDERVDYIAYTNMNDREAGRAQKSSLTASQYAIRRNGLVIPIGLPIPTEAAEQGTTPLAIRHLHQRYDALGYIPEYLAIVGAHDALPQVKGQSIFNNGEMGHPVTDIPYGQVDTDPFLDLALGRIVADNLEEASALATRTVTYEQLADGYWEQQFVESGLWGFDEARDLFTNVGFDDPTHPTEAEISSMGMMEAAAVLHKDHSNCMILGHALDVNTDVLFSPAVVASMGCSVAGMDIVGPDERTIVDHILGSGAVAFLGASRNAIAENTYLHVAFWNDIFDGATLGQAYQKAINDLIVHWQDENGSAALRYTIDIEMLYGDPALTMDIPGEAQVAPAAARVEGNQVIVTGPEEWTMVQYAEAQLAEWNYDKDLFMYVGPGATPRTYWSGQYDNEDLYYAVSIPLAAGFGKLQQTTDLPDPLGWRGNAYVDDRLDGTQHLRWRVRLLDYEMTTGEIRSRADQIEFVVE